ncbi:hypothetical protein [Sphingomonas colocasiae]|uniref:Uncharacterized protein n=1 Tax=Sphingomonas colocasiae TaxID=1848973 RepID=A0ABS7Q1B6_9SPHN|nr:hypothetical protein [Sphingomonas colocasiae]MBY8826322.1 hypothetical protein [Sphingomonas colocasiae]
MGYFDDLNPEGIGRFALGDADLPGLAGPGGLDPYGLTRPNAARPGSAHVTEAGAAAFRQGLHAQLARRERAELAAFLQPPPSDNKVVNQPADTGRRAPPQAGRPRRAHASILIKEDPRLPATREEIDAIYPGASREVRIPYADPRRRIRIVTDSLEGIAAKVAELPEGSVFVAEDAVYRKGGGNGDRENGAGDWRDTVTPLSRRELIEAFGPAEVKRLDRRMELYRSQQERALLARVAARMADRAPPAAIPPLRQSPQLQAIHMLFGGNRRIPGRRDDLAIDAVVMREMTPAERQARQRRWAGRERWNRKAEAADTDPRSVVAKKWAQNLPQRAKTWLGGLMEWGVEANRQYQDFTHVGADLIRDTSAFRDAQYRRDVALARRLRREGVEAIAANTPKFGSEVDRYAYEIGNGVVDLVGAIGITALTRSPAAGSALLSAQVWGDRYGRSREDGRSHGQATMDAAVYSVAEFIPERLAIGKILKPGGTFAGRIVKSGSAQAIQETVTEAIQMGYDAGILKEDMSWGDAFQRLKDAAIIGGGSGGIVSGAVAPFRRGGSARPGASDRIDRYPPIARVEQGIASSLDNINAPPAVWIEPGQRGSGPPTAAAGDIAGKPAPSVSIEGRQAVIRGADPSLIAEIEAGLPKGTRALRRSDGAFVLHQRHAEAARAAIGRGGVRPNGEIAVQEDVNSKSPKPLELDEGHPYRGWLELGGSGQEVRPAVDGGETAMLYRVDDIRFPPRISADGAVPVVATRARGERTLFVGFDPKRAVQFAEINRKGNASITVVEVDASFRDTLRSTSIYDKDPDIAEHPSAPLWVDIDQGVDQYGLRTSEHIQMLRGAIRPGTVRVLRPGEYRK